MSSAKSSAKAQSVPPQAGKKLAGGGKIRGFFAENKFIILAFAVPFILMAVAFAVKDVAPFGIFRTMVLSIGKLLGFDCQVNTAKPWGTQQMLVVDLCPQYFPCLQALHSKLQSGGSLFWTWSVGMGTNFIALMAYYLMSPLNFLSIAVPSSVLVEYLTVITVIKIACAGMFTAIAFKMVFKKDGLALVIAGTLFAMCAFNMGYYWNTIWLDSVAMLPLVFAGTVCLLRDGKFKLFTISLACAVVFNYYIGFMICIAVFIIAVGYTICRFVSFKKSLRDLLRTAAFSAISLLLTAPITIPAYLALGNCYQQTTKFPTKFDINIGEDTVEGVFDAIHQIFGNMLSFLKPTAKEGLPNVACGVFCLILLGVFFCARKIKLSEKLVCLGTMVFLISSFIFRSLDYIWHGFHYPNMLPYRFSFLFCFLMVYMAFRAFTSLKEGDYIDVTVGTLVFSLILIGYFLLKETVYNHEGTGASKTGVAFNEQAGIWSAVIGVVMLILLFLFVLKILPKKAVTVIISVVVLAEMCVTGVIGVYTVGSTTTTGYPPNENDVKKLVAQIDSWDSMDPDWNRTEFSKTSSLNDGALNGFSGISMFNSMANVNITKYVEYLGLGGWPAGNRYTYYQTSPVTNVILNLRYMMARDGVSYDQVYMKNAASSGSVVLYENTAYIPQGYVVNNALSSFEIEPYTTGNPGTVDNPFENQIEWWQKATGIEEPVYTQLTVRDQGHSASVTKYADEGHYSASVKDGTGRSLKFNFYLPEDGLVLTYLKVGSNEGDGHFKINDEKIGTFNDKCAFINNLGYRTKDTKVSLCGDFTGSSSSIRAYCYMLNEEVFEKGLEILRSNVLDTTKAADTVLEGTINTSKSGLLYTSIPYEKGWHAVVDGKEVQIVAIADGVCAVPITSGEHTVKFYYIPDGFILGVAAFTVALLLFAAMCLLTGKKLREKKNLVPVRAALWLCDTKSFKTRKERLLEAASAENPEASGISGETSRNTPKKAPKKKPELFKNLKPTESDDYDEE